MLDFGMLPPEVNSTLMYSGAGSGPMLAAASAWDALAWQLDSFATGYSATLSELQGQTWSGGSAESMAAAAAPYVAWASATATQAELAANQARTAATAYETAFAATVPPPVVAANRAQLATLVATNFFGQNTGAIAATEALYAGMWAQDATAMYGYAAAAAAATRLAPFHQPPQTTNVAGQSAQAAAQAQTAGSTLTGNSQGAVSHAMSVLPQQLSGLGTADPSNPLAAMATSMLSGVDNLNTVSHPTVLGMQGFRTFAQIANYVMRLLPAGASAVKAPAAAVAAGFTPVPGGQGVVLASMSEAASVGSLSVPTSWPAAPTNSAALQTLSAETLPPATASEPTTARSTAHRGGPMAPAGAGPVRALGAGRKGYPVLRMRDRRYRIPRPAVGG